MSLFDELKRRGVMRMSALYLVGAWAALQVADLLVGILELADGTLRMLTLVLLAGFPVALIVSWFYELTPEGLRRDLHREGEPLREDDHPHRGRLNYVIIGVLLLGVSVLLIDRYLVEPPVDTPAARTSAADFEGLQPLPQEGIAILPFDNLSELEENAFFAAGIHEEVLSLASRALPMKVTSRTSVMRVDPELAVPEIGRTLGVAHILEGSVRRQGDRVRVTVQLIDARTDEHLWAGNFDATIDDVFKVQDEVASAIADQLQVSLDTPAAADTGTSRNTDPEAYRLYLEAMDLLRDYRFRDDPKARQRHVGGAEKLFRAVELDPEFAAAWARIPDAAEILGPRGRELVGVDLSDNEGYRTFIVDAARRAVALDPTLPEAHVALAGLLDGDERLAQLEEALRFDPNNVEALAAAAQRYAIRGDNDIARDYLERALSVDPLNYNAHEQYAMLMQQQGRLDQALAHLRRIEELTGQWTWLEANVLREMNDLYGYFLELHRWVIGMPNGNQSTYLADRLLEIDPSGETSERWLEFAHGLLDGGRYNHGFLVHVKIALRRGEMERAARVMERFREAQDGPDRHSGFERYRERALWDAGDREGFIAARSALRDRLLEAASRLEGVDGYVITEPRYVNLFQTLALVAFSLGETELAEEAIAVAVDYFDANRFNWGFRAQAHDVRAIQHLLRGEYDDALAEYEQAFLLGQDMEGVMRSYHLYVVVDPTPSVFFEGPRFQQLLERSRALRRETFERLQAEAPEVLFPEEELIMDLHEAWRTDEWEARQEQSLEWRPRYSLEKVYE